MDKAILPVDNGISTYKNIKSPVDNQGYPQKAVDNLVNKFNFQKNNKVDSSCLVSNFESTLLVFLD